MPGKTELGYSDFIKKQLDMIKRENPGVDHKVAFVVAANMWKSSPENPENNK